MGFGRWPQWEAWWPADCGGFQSGAAPVHSFFIFGLTMKHFNIFQLSLNVVDISQIFPRDSSVGF